MYDEIMASLILFSKTTQPTVINNRKIIHHTMLSYLNVAIVKIPFRSRVMGFSNNCLLFFVLMGKVIFDWQQWYGCGVIYIYAIPKPPAWEFPATFTPSSVAIHYQKSLYKQR